MREREKGRERVRERGERESACDRKGRREGERLSVREEAHHTEHIYLLNKR